MFRQRGLTADSLRTLDDLRKIPFTAKADLLNTPDHPQRARDFVLVPDSRVLARRPATIARALLFGREEVKRRFEAEFRPIFLTSTTGRSAEPIPFLFTRHDLDNLSVTGARLMELCAAQPEFRLLNLFPYAPHLAFWQTHYGAMAFGFFCVSSGGGKVMGTEGNIRLIRKIRPEAIAGMPTFIYHVLRQAQEDGVQWKNLKRIVLGGEKVPEGMRRKLRQLAAALGSPKVDVMATYGFTEAKMAWTECPAPPDQPSAGYHLYPDLGLFEVINPATGEAVPDGQPGELVFTPLDARGTVVLRYRTGDYLEGRITYEPCPYCGRSLPRLVGNISRRTEIKEMQLDKIKGTLVDFNQLEHVLDDEPHIGAWQLELRKVHDDPLELDELVLHIQKLDDTDNDQLVRDLNRRFTTQTEVHPNRVMFHDADEMRRLQGVGTQLKEQKILDNRPKPSRGLAPEKVELSS
jgi:phenylacetate-coenzyme A ligase PaaK-like adenylate-forming protein